MTKEALLSLGGVVLNIFHKTNFTFIILALSLFSCAENPAIVQPVDKAIVGMWQGILHTDKADTAKSKVNLSLDASSRFNLKRLENGNRARGDFDLNPDKKQFSLTFEESEIEQFSLVQQKEFSYSYTLKENQLVLSSNKNEFELFKVLEEASTREINLNTSCIDSNNDLWEVSLSGKRFFLNYVSREADTTIFMRGDIKYTNEGKRRRFIARVRESSPRKAFTGLTGYVPEKKTEDSEQIALILWTVDQQLKPITGGLRINCTLH